VTPFAQRELNKVIERTLKDAGLTKPPIRLKDVLEHLELFQEFYDLSDPSFLDKTKHKIRVGRHRLIQVVKKIKLQAVLFFDENRVAIDHSLPVLKREWPAFHEAGHRICPGHREVSAFGDTAQTLRPDYQEKLEAEANFVGAGLMFCGKRFTAEARDTTPCWDAINKMANSFGRTKTTTLRRYAGFGPDCAMAAVIGTPVWKVDSENLPGSWRHFVPSPKFADRFSNADVNHMVEWVTLHANPKRGGQVASFPLVLKDDNDDRHEFLAEAFFNTHDLLMIFVHQRKLNGRGRIIVPEPSMANL
jgi:hypothetical protein